MSEETEINPLNIGAFVLAMIGGPLIVTALTFWMAFIPVFALVFGGIPFLLIGTPMALWMALTGPITFERGAKWGGLTILFITASAIIFTTAIQQSDDVGFVLGVGGVSAVFATFWAGAAAGLYNAMTKPKSITPITN